jgi:uncharacterized protein (TIGR02996 family)
MNRTAFLEAIKAEPDDDTHRLVFANWLEENGEPERAEFIRLQVEWARLDWTNDRGADLQLRERELLARHGETWLGPLRGLVKEPQYRRGLLHAQAVGQRALAGLESLAETEALAWVAELKVRGLDTVLAGWLAGCRLLAHLTALDLGNNGIQDEGVQALAAAPSLSRLTALDLSRNGIRAEGAAALASSPHLARLTALDLGRNRIGPEGAQALAGSPYLTRLTSLALSENAVGDDGAGALAAASHFSQLTALDLTYNRIGPEGARALAGSPHLARLRALYLSDNAIGDEGARALAASPHLRQIASLDVGANYLGDDAIAALRRRFGLAVEV